MNNNANFRAPGLEKLIHGNRGVLTSQSGEGTRQKHPTCHQVLVGVLKAADRPLSYQEMEDKTGFSPRKLRYTIFYDKDRGCNEIELHHRRGRNCFYTLRK